MGRIGFTLLGAFMGFCAGAMAGTLLGLVWTAIFPSPDLPTNPQAGMGIVLGTGLAGEITGILAGAVLGWRKGASRSAPGSA